MRWARRFEPTVKGNFSHYANFYGVPCYWNEMTSELAGRTWFWDLFIVPLAYFHNYFVGPFMHDNAFPIIITGEIEDGAQTPNPAP